MKDLPPAKDRVNEYKRKCFGRLFTGLAVGRDKSESGGERNPPMTSSSSLMQGEMTTQAQSVFEEEEGAKYSLPFERFYSNAE